MQTLITHINPHLDDICAIWLYRKFHSESKDANLEFIPASKEAASDESEDKIYFGTGGGRFDEHKEGSKDSAASLVWAEVQKNATINEIEKKALDELINWNTLVDTGQAPHSELSPFAVQSYLRPLDSTQEGSKKAVLLGEEILDRILEVLKRNQQAKLDFEKAVKFESKFGQGVGVTSETVNRAFCTNQEGDLFLMVNPKDKSVQFFTPKQIDLEPLYKKLKEQDPEADWFLHQSHHIILCGAGAQPVFKATKLSFEQLIKVTNNV